MNGRILLIASALSTLALATACSDARDVKVKGDVAAEPAVDATKPIRVEVYEAKSTDYSKDEAEEGDELSFVDAFDVEKLGDFEHTLSITADTVHVVALVDANDNGQCDDGEAWGAADADVAEDDTVNVSLKITERAQCPALPAAPTPSE